MSVHFFAKKVSTVAFVLWPVLGVATAATAQVQTAIEYGHADPWDDCYWDIVTPGQPLGPPVCYYDAYFVTSFPDEIAALDAAFSWRRTGETFNVWSGPESGALPTCRFFNGTFRHGPTTGLAYYEHFYTPYAAECTAVQAHADWRWVYEGTAFYLQVPDANGNCPLGTTILYRLYWTGGAPYHRLTASAETFDEMLAEGWIFEGDGRTGAFACVPSSTESSTP